MVIFWLSLCFVIVLGKEEVPIDVEDPAKAIQAMTEAIGAQVWVCRREIAFELELIEAFRLYWNAMKGLKDAMGCVVRCVLTKLELMSPAAELMVGNFQAFGEANGASNFTIRGLVDLIKLCQEYTNAEGCAKWLDIANCFRAGVFQLHWEPPMAEYDEY